MVTNTKLIKAIEGMEEAGEVSLAEKRHVIQDGLHSPEVPHEVLLFLIALEMEGDEEQTHSRLKE